MAAPATAGAADAALLALVTQYIAAVAEEVRMIDFATDVEEELVAEPDFDIDAAVKAAMNRASALADEIASCPASTLAGLRAKARAAKVWFEGREDECPIAQSLLDDLLHEDSQADRQSTPAQKTAP